MQHFVVMGVTGCGKSTIAEGMAKQMKAHFIEADSLHGDANISKMANGTPLTDEDRWPWLLQVGKAMRNAEKPVIVSCSCLKRSYRDSLREHAQLAIGFVHLHTDREVFATRMTNRTDHFMPVSLLDSQLDILEHLQDDESGILVDCNQPVESVVVDGMVYVGKMLG